MAYVKTRQVKQTRIVGLIPEVLKRDLERFVRARGLKKNFILEQALRHHLQALRELPQEFIIPPTIVVSRKWFKEVLMTKRQQARPTAALRRLMRGRMSE